MLIVCSINAHLQYSEYQTIIFQQNAGYASRLPDNRHIKRQLLRMGLTKVRYSNGAMKSCWWILNNKLTGPLSSMQENIFACLFDFLFRPTPAAYNLLMPELQQLVDPSIFKIGVQIRTPDHTFENDDSHLFAYQYLLDCAASMESQMTEPGQVVKYYVLTSSRNLRKQIKDKYGDKVLIKEVDLKHVTDNKWVSNRLLTTCP